jgi:hypothetical protein
MLYASGQVLGKKGLYMANRNFASGGKIYSMHVKPVLLDCNFVVDSANGNGLGIRSLKGPMIQNVFMHTSASPGQGNSNPASPNVSVINPNPAPGTIVVQFQDNFNRSFSGCSSNVSPVSGSPLTSVVANTAYTIVSLGSSSAAQLQAVGLPSGIAPAVGASFIASQSAAIAGGAAVEIAAAAGSGIMSIETLGDPNQTIAPNPSASQGFGGYIILQCRNNSAAIAAPADGSVISLQFLLSDSSVQVMGE